MFVVALLGTSAGFVMNRLVHLLREQGYSLADAFRLAAEVSEGAQVAIEFSTLRQADEFAQAARKLETRVEIRVPSTAKRVGTG